VRWVKQRPDLVPEEVMFALQRGLLQCELKSLLVCNSMEGWGLIHANAEPLAKKVFAASFAVYPLGGGFETCPVFHMQGDPAPNLTIITDNDPHAERMREYNGVKVTVIPPICTYDGESKRSQLEKKRFRVLWAGRGSPEKNPEFLPELAKCLDGVADIHVWGDVKPMNGPESLKYRGPFDGFASIDGSYDCYINTSITEGCPNSAMEAILADLPVVAPPIGALRTIATSNAVLDPQVFAKAVMDVCNNPVSGAGPKQLVLDWSREFPARVAELVQ
jgi:glycosyltransferase involved in cell wall biosynthesis